MNTITTRTSHAAADEPEVQIGKFESVRVLGSVSPRPSLAGRTFVEYDGREFEILGRVNPATFGDPPRAGEVWFSRTTNIVEPRTGARRDNHFLRAREHPVGEFVRRQRQAEAVARRQAARRGELPPTALDLLADVDVLQAKPAKVVMLGGDLPAESSIGPGARLLRRGVRHIDLPDLPPIRGPRAIIEAAELEGDELSLIGGHLLVRTRTGGKYRAAIALAAPLIVGILKNEPVMCAFGHDGPAREAVTLLAVDVPACEEHKS